MEFTIATDISFDYYGNRIVMFYVSAADTHLGTFATAERAGRFIADKLVAEQSRVIRDARDMTDDKIRAIGPMTYWCPTCNENGWCATDDGVPPNTCPGCGRPDCPADGGDCPTGH